MEDLFRIPYGSEYFDHSHDYLITLNKEFTVGEFIQYVLSNFSDEYGTINIWDAMYKGVGAFFNFRYPKWEYNKGGTINIYAPIHNPITPTIATDILNLPIIKILAQGEAGSYMYYFLVIDEDRYFHQYDQQIKDDYCAPLKDIKVRTELTYPQLSKELGVSKSTLRRWFSGQSTPSDYLSDKLAELAKLPNKSVRRRFTIAHMEYVEHEELKSKRFK